MDIIARKIIMLSFCILLGAVLCVGCSQAGDLRSPCAVGDTMFGIAHHVPCIKRDVEMNVYFM
ncbi:hypothetical protein Fsol_00236 [Candidatus Fokinia solitaria]|uniref:Uncharacterized protein n=1 Tax=Candidatus Fokinia solitaria TaxID=1802984 RepID=A0A2U8BRY8_9RICK|nr:hypothetical protein [Candidatus Fokinia solitaria]AWD33040.1 hypothetical protein Fsol_00236 [Candidatus Fokinia solitaria]